MLAARFGAWQGAHQAIGTPPVSKRATGAAMVLDDGLPTATSRDQAELERRVLQIYGKDYADGEQGAGSRVDASQCRRALPLSPPLAAAAFASGVAAGLCRTRQDGVICRRFRP